MLAELSAGMDYTIVHHSGLRKPAGGGISGGAVAAIAIGATVAVGGAGFSVYWFIIRKKTRK